VCTTVPTTEMSNTPIEHQVENTQEEQVFIESCRQYRPAKQLEFTGLNAALACLKNWAKHGIDGLEQHMLCPEAVIMCMRSMESMIQAHSHFLDHRQHIEIMWPYLYLILMVFDWYIKHENFQTRHQVCHAIVHFLACVSGRVNNGPLHDEFSERPRTFRRDEYALFQTLDWTEENAAQVAAPLLDKKMTLKVLQEYLAQLKTDEVEWRRVFDNIEGKTKDPEDYFDEFGSKMQSVQSLVQWVEHGMFLCLVPLANTRCPCKACRKIYGKDFAYAQ